MADLNETALGAAHATLNDRLRAASTRDVIAAYFASLAEQGIVLVDVREIMEWLRCEAMAFPCAADAIEAHFAPVSGLEKTFKRAMDSYIEPGDGLEGDHKDRDKLNNRRYNLRVATHALNSQNQDARGYKGSSSRFRGVSLRKLTGKWKAQIRISGKLHFLGYFDDEEEAGRVAAEAREQMMSFTEN